MPNITDVRGEEIKDSRGNPTLNITLVAENLRASAAVPSGKSTGSHEAKELRDDDGLGVQKALAQIKSIIKPALLNSPLNQKTVDDLLIKLDGTPNKERLGGNTLIGISMALARLIAQSKNIPLWKSIAEELGDTTSFPDLYMNIINGGAHADFRLPFQEYMIVFPGSNPRIAYEEGSLIFKKLGKIINTHFGYVPKGDEGGYSPAISSLTEPFELLQEASAGYANITFAIDVAASLLLHDGTYVLGNKKMSPNDLILFYEELTKQFPIKSIEDPFSEDDNALFKSITERLGNNIKIVGDDFTVTNPARVKRAIAEESVNALIIKPNQIGTLTETYEVLNMAKKAGWKSIVSHRSGDTNDSFIADLAVGVGAHGLKAGSPEPPERRVKYERLVEIFEKEMLP